MAMDVAIATITPSSDFPGPARITKKAVENGWVLSLDLKVES